MQQSAADVEKCRCVGLTRSHCVAYAGVNSSSQAQWQHVPTAAAAAAGYAITKHGMALACDRRSKWEERLRMHRKACTVVRAAVQQMQAAGSPQADAKP
jgi:hypothetical protein